VNRFLWWKCLDWNGLFWCLGCVSTEGRCTTSYLLAGPVCLWCLCFKYPNHPRAKLPNQEIILSNILRVHKNSSAMCWGELVTYLAPFPRTNFYPRKIICTFPLQIYHLLWTTHYLPSGEHNWIFPKHSTATQCCIQLGVVMLGCKFWWNQGSSFSFPPRILVIINCKNIHSN